jgi:hypothetical protein
MRVQFGAEGGFAHIPGLSRPVTIDTSELSDEEAAQLERLIEMARFFALPEEVEPIRRAPGSADYRTYSITVETADESHTVRFIEPIGDAHLQALIAELRTLQRRISLGGA